MRHLFVLISLLPVLEACGPVADKNTNTTSHLDSATTAACDTRSDTHIHSLFTQRVMSTFAPRISCNQTIAGADADGQAYGTMVMTFADAEMFQDTDAIGGIIQYVDVSPEISLDRDWFVEHRADFANGYDQYMDWDTDADDDPQIEQYWAPDVLNVQVKVSLREDGSIAQIWFSNPN